MVPSSPGRVPVKVELVGLAKIAVLAAIVQKVAENAAFAGELNE